MSVEVQKVELAKYKGPDVYVRVLNALEELALRDAIRNLSESKDLIAAQLQAFVCDADGKQRLPDLAAALAFMEGVRLSTTAKIIRAADKLNELSDESLQEAEKN